MEALRTLWRRKNVLPLQEMEPGFPAHSRKDVNTNVIRPLPNILELISALHLYQIVIPMCKNHKNINHNIVSSSVRNQGQ
jgi:hypothetical protein